MSGKLRSALFLPLNGKDRPLLGLNKLPLTRIRVHVAEIIYKVITMISGKGPILITRRGIRYEIDPSEGLDLELFITGNYQSHMTFKRHFSLPVDSVILDIGANFGVMALQFAAVANEGRVISFEPTKYALSRFRKNMELNPELAMRVSVVHSFVTAETQSDASIKAVYASWMVDGTNSSHTVHPVHLGTLRPSEGVGSVTLNDFCKNAKLERVDLVKIDTDGTELEVLKGAIECISRYRPKIIFEVGQYLLRERGIHFTSYLDYFSELNYSLFDCKTGRAITHSNFASVIPRLSTIDALAQPL